MVAGSYGVALEGDLEAQPGSTDSRGESQPWITAQRRSAASKGTALWVRRRSTLDRAHDRDSSTMIGGSRLSGRPAGDAVAAGGVLRRRAERGDPLARRGDFGRILTAQ